MLSRLPFSLHMGFSFRRTGLLNRGRDRRFESPFLQRGVCLTGAFHGSWRKGPAFAGGVSLDETRELDALATSPLALAAFSDRH